MIRQSHKLLKLLSLLPAGYRHIIKKTYNFLSQPPYLIIRSKKWPINSIVVYAVNNYWDSEWSPNSINTGCGGAEQAVIYITKEWVKLGYRVTVFANCGSNEGTYEGVTYLKPERFNRYDTFDTIIIWRDCNLSLLDNIIKAKRIWLDLHDIPQPKNFTTERIKRITRIFAKSMPQVSSLPSTLHKKAVVIPNGIQRSYFTQYQNIRRDPFKLIYATCYMRGLKEILIYGWPLIKKEIPKASFHIFAPPYSRCSKELNNLMKQPEVFHRGSVGIDEIMREKASSSIYYYPGVVKETDCLSIKEAAAVGCLPVVSEWACTFDGGYCVKIPGDPRLQSTQEAIALKIVELLKDQERLDKLRGEFRRRLSSSISWGNVAKSWLMYLE